MDFKKLKEAALKYGTPIYLYDLKIIENQFQRLKKELSVYYARPYSKFFLPAEFQNLTITLGKACIGKFSEEKIFEDLFKTLPTEKF